MMTTTTKTGNTTTTTRMTRTTTRMRRKPKSHLVLLLPALCLAQILLSQGKPKAGQKAEPYAVVAGTVFRDPGFAQPGASVVLALKSAPAKKLQHQISSPRGEFTLPGPRRPQYLPGNRYIKRVSDRSRRD